MFHQFLKVAGATLLWSSVALATQPMPPKVQITPEISGQTIILKLENREKTPVIAEIFPGTLTSLQFAATRAQIAPGQSTSLKAAITNEARGRQVLHLQTRILLGDKIPVAGPSVYQPFFLNGQLAKKMTYEEAFLSAREAISGKSDRAEIDLGGVKYVSEINRLAFKAKEVPAGMQIEPYRARTVAEYAKMPLRQLPKDIGLGGANGISEESEPQSLDSILEENSSSIDEADSLSPYVDINAVTIKGHMSLKTGPSTYKAAWGWVVRAWQNLGGAWIFLGWTYVGGDGAWQISLPATLPGIPVRIEYLTKNRFVSIQDAKGYPYTWGDNWNLSGTTMDIGYRYADLTVNGDLPAVDRLYVGATNIWVKFFSLGMNALRDQPIQVYFPNTMASGQCIYNDGAGPYAWSCSYWNDGRIYIIPEHGSESVVQHEIAHSINSYYWNGSMPAGAGGSHNLWDCYNNGLALTEGFANFVTYWTQFDRTNAAPAAPYFNMNIESLPAGVCANQTAEMRIAATFWDTYDSHSENVNATTGDGLHYINQGVPVAIYLNNKRNSMSDYLAVVQSGQSAFWQNEFTRLFRLNKIVP